MTNATLATAWTALLTAHFCPILHWLVITSHCLLALQLPKASTSLIILELNSTKITHLLLTITLLATEEQSEVKA